MLKLHKRDAEDFETGEILNDAVNVTEQRKLNEIACVEFDYPMNEKAHMIEENMLISCEGRVYEIWKILRKMDGRDVLRVTTEDLFSYRAKHTFLPNVSDMMGKKISYVIDKALEIANEKLPENRRFSVFTKSELDKLDLNRVGDDKFKIDFFSTDKLTLWEFLQTVLENLGRGELYSDKYKFAIVDRVGKDRGVRLTFEKNMENIEIERSTENIVTKLYPFGTDDLTIKHAKISENEEYGKEYILSPNAVKYGIHEGYKDYSDYTEPEKILANALWEFSGQSEKEDENETDISVDFGVKNENRIDIPQITISGQLIDLSKLAEYGDMMKVELGDTVHVFDTDGTEYVERVIEGIWHPYDAETTTVSIGHMRDDFFFSIFQLFRSRKQFMTVQTTNKQIATRKMQGVVNTDRNSVQSENDLFKIIGDLQSISEKEGRVRIRIGNYNGEFVFIIYDKQSNKAVYLNEFGEAVYAGTIQTMKDCIIQGELRVGLGGDNTKGIAFYGDSYQPDENGNYSAPYARILPYVANNEDFKGINVEGGKLCVEGDPVATRRDFDNLKTAIDILTEKYNNLKKQVDTMS